jgi:D-alanine-D-alanine ligase-like ATP-grasp enzyme
MTETSLLPKAAAVAGLSFLGLCEKIARLSLQSRTTQHP